MRSAITVLGLALLTACGGGYNPDKEARNNIPSSQSVGTQKVEIISGESTLNFNNGIISGSGIIKSATALSEVNSANNFEISFRLTDGGNLVFLANSKRDLSAGVEIEFQRASGTNLLTVIARAGMDVLDMSSSFSSVDASTEMSFFIDMHNDHGNETHVIFWDASGNLILEDILRGKGFGANWGLSLNSAEVSLVKVSPPKDEH
jgi:hypothetical protein